MLDAPDLENPLLCRKTWYRIKPSVSCISTYDIERAKQSFFKEVVVKATSPSENAKVIDTLALLCERGKCSNYRNGQAIFFDKGHITTTAARKYVAPVIMEAVQ